MSKSHLLLAFELIEKNKDKSHFADVPKTEKLICLAEKTINIKFPSTYRQFVQRYGCGSIKGFEVYGLTDESFDYYGSLDAIGLTLEERENGDIPVHFILIGDVGDGFYYCLDSSQPNEDGEYPVVIWGYGVPEKNKEKVAEDFGEFLLNQLIEALEDEEVAPPA
jgi:cell wall assembly regulator SMI1